MNTTSDFDRTAAAWLADGPTELNDRVLDAALREVHLTPQRGRSSAPWRTSLMSSRIGLAAVLGLVAVAGMFGFAMLGGGPPPGPSPSPTAASNATQLPPLPSAVETPLPSGPLDTTSWIPFESSRYGFALRLPPDWTAAPADRDWAWGDVASNWLSTGADRFRAPGREILVSAWTVPLEPGQKIESWADVEAWAKTYCERTANSDCATIHDRVVPMCVEKRDCHPALLIPFKDDVQAFGTGGVLPAGMLVVAVWWDETAPATAAYGGTTRLLEAFLSTLNIWAPAYPESQDAAATFRVTGT